jgi:SAM-dependent methyltransferase
LQGNRVRHLILHREGKSTLYRSDTGDFTDAEIRTTKDELEQVYLDLHEKGTLQEFLSAVRRVRTHVECTGCPDRAACCGAVVVDEEPAFEREERWIRKEISRLRGRVLDVGCGDQLYRDLIGKLIADGQIEYHGVDPDGAALERMRSAGVGGTLHHSEIETFEFEPGYFDYILALRSLNHFRDMQKAFSVFARVMRVHGQFVLCDSVAYGLLRTHEQASYADAHAPVGHEHWRNWSSQQVVDFARRYPFRVDVHRPVSARSCNQWIVKLMRIPDEPSHGAAG